MERGTGGGQQPYHHTAATASRTYLTTSTTTVDDAYTKRKPPKLKSLNRSISMAIDDYEGAAVCLGNVDDSTLIVEQPLIHRSASPVTARSAPPQTLALPPTSLYHGSGGGSGAVSPALSARHQQQHLHSFRQYSMTGSPTMRAQARALSPVLGGGGTSASAAGSTRHEHHQQQHRQHPDIYLVSSGSLGEGLATDGDRLSPLQFIDDYMLPPPHAHHAATHPLKKSMFRRSDTIDVHPGSSSFQMKKTHSFHAQNEPQTVIDPLMLNAANVEKAPSSRRTSSVRGNFLMPIGHTSTKDLSRSPSPSRRGRTSHRSLYDTTRRPSDKPDTVLDSQIRHPSLNDDLIETMNSPEIGGIMAPSNLSLENELFIESHSRSNSHTNLDEVGMTGKDGTAFSSYPRSVGIRKASASFDEGPLINGSTSAVAVNTSSLKKRDHSHVTSRQHSTHSLELDGRPSTSAAAAAASVSAHSSLHLHSAATAATAAYHFKRGTQHGRSLYLSPNNLEDFQVHHRPTMLAAAAAFQGPTAGTSSLKQAKALHSASMRLKTYRETLSASKKSKSFISDSNYPPPPPPPINLASEFIELTSPQRRNSGRAPLPAGAVPTLEEIKRSPRATEEKRSSFERKSSLTYELGDAAFEQVLRPFHHKAATGIRKTSIAGSHRKLKKKSPSDETEEDHDSDRKRKRIVCIVMTVFFCLVFASVFVVIVTLTHSSGQAHPLPATTKKSSPTYGKVPVHHYPATTKKTSAFKREVPVLYNVRQESERLKEALDRGRFNNTTELASAATSASSSSLLIVNRVASIFTSQQHQQQQQAQAMPFVPLELQVPQPQQ